MPSSTAPLQRRPWPGWGLTVRWIIRARLEPRSDDDARAERLSYPHRPPHADGRSVAALLDSGAARAGSARAGLSAGARQADVGAAARLSRHAGESGRDRRVLRPSRGIALVRPQRGKRTALPLSRLEIRR